MSKYDPAELLSFCDAILEDSEVSVDEVYAIAEWLNSNPSACDHWPGNLMVGPLQAIWADDKTTETELQIFAQVLTSIQQERQKRESKRAKADAGRVMDSSVASAFQDFDESVPWIPAINVASTEESMTEPGQAYHVDLLKQTCSCPNWMDYRRSELLGSPLRFCKHMFSALGNASRKEDWPAWLGCLVQSGTSLRPGSSLSVAELPGGAALIVVSDRPWCDVIAWKAGSYSRFGFNRLEHRWAYGNAPEGPMEIRRLIRQFHT